MNTPLSASPAAPKKRWFDLRRPLPAENATERTTAFVYGNVLVLAVLVQVSLEEITGGSVVAVLATAVSTFLVHIFAGVITTKWAWQTVLRETRDSTPILTSGTLPAAVLLTTVLFEVPSGVTALTAELVVVARIALIGLVVARLRAEPLSSRNVLAGIAFALLGVIIVVTKVVLTH